MADLPSSSETSHEARLEAVLESVSEGFYALDSDWRYVVFNRAAEAYFGVSRKLVLGKVIWEIFPQGLGTPFETHCRAAMTDGVSTTFETSSRLRPDRVVELKIVPLRGGGVAVTLTDISERKQADARQRLLVNELNHRVKNALATVQAIAAQSLRGSDVSDEIRARFMSRLMALSRANDVLVAENWTGANLMAIATDVASPHGMEERFTIEGPPVRLAPQTATAMALGLHELATNAAKYGALSAPEGRVALTWTLDGDEGSERKFSMTWRESGGPAVKPPGTSGFGTRLIERGLAGELRGQTKLHYATEGLVFTLVAPVGELLSEG
jgi:PAS domain S-box-containing protein